MNHTKSEQGHFWQAEAN